MIDLPRLRPYARQGKPYVAEMKALWKDLRYDLKADFETIEQRNRKITLTDVITLALKYELQVKMTFDFLEEMNCLPCGTYDRLKRRGLRPMAALREVWEAQQQEATR